VPGHRDMHHGLRMPAGTISGGDPVPDHRDMDHGLRMPAGTGASCMTPVIAGRELSAMPGIVQNRAWP